MCCAWRQNPVGLFQASTLTSPACPSEQMRTPTLSCFHFEWAQTWKLLRIYQSRIIIRAFDRFATVFFHFEIHKNTFKGLETATKNLKFSPRGCKYKVHLHQIRMCVVSHYMPVPALSFMMFSLPVTFVRIPSWESGVENVQYAKQDLFLETYHIVLQKSCKIQTFWHTHILISTFNDCVYTIIHICEWLTPHLISNIFNIWECKMNPTSSNRTAIH